MMSSLLISNFDDPNEEQKVMPEEALKGRPKVTSTVMSNEMSFDKNKKRKLEKMYKNIEETKRENLL